ncbi:MAG: tetratricopeptide repeat protein [Bacteroidota bacterium]
MRNLFPTYFLLLFLSLTNAQTSAVKLNDSAMAIYKKDPQKALVILKSALKKAKDASQNQVVLRTKNNLGIVYRDLGKYQEALELSKTAVIAKETLVRASALINVGVCHRNLANYDEAISNYLKALKIYEAINNERQMAVNYNAIGLVYSYNSMGKKALQYHKKAKDIFSKLDNKKGLSEVYNNIAIIYANDGRLEQALNNFQYSLEIETELGDKKGMAESVNNVGAVYYYMNEIDSALVYFERSVSIEKSIGNKAGVAASYNNIADVLLESNRLQAAKTFIDSAMYFSEDSKVAVDIETALFNYSKYFELNNNNKQALAYYKRMSLFRDSILNLETNQKIAQLEIEYDTEKKEKQILKQRVDLAEKELALSKKNIQLLVLGISALILISISYLFYNQQKLKNRQLQKENELKDALIKIETQNRLQEQRLRISRDLHDNIGAQLTFIISSIDNLKYGFEIKNEKLKSKLTKISQFTSSTITELRDTIWAMNKNEISFEDLQSRISNYIDKAHLYDDDIDFVFKVDDTIDAKRRLSSVEGMNVHRIIQEAIHNSLKHAKPSKISVVISTEKNDKLKISISDDGIGFDQAEVELGSGLNNMKKRAQNIRADFKINSSQNNGTEVEILV